MPPVPGPVGLVCGTSFSLQFAVVMVFVLCFVYLLSEPSEEGLNRGIKGVLVCLAPVLVLAQNIIITSEAVSCMCH